MPDAARPLVVSHRAHAGTHPENTLLGIRAALEDGVEAIEIDVRATRDGQLVLMHDTTMARTTGDRRGVAEVDLADLAAVQVRPRTVEQEPQPIPTLEDAMRLIDGRAAIVIDFVDEPLADPLIDLVRRLQAAPWTWWTAHRPTLAQRLAEATPGSRSLLGWTPDDGYFATPIEALDACVRRGLTGLNADHRYVDATVVRYAHREDLLLGVWTVNEPRRMDALARMGVDAVTTDYPLALQAVRARVLAETAPPRPTMPGLRWQHRG
jgi:glycerophosphoryl diester phosphodiesterase